jgi:Ca-activated chloride channel family protein
VDKIIKDTLAKNTANTRIFTFGVGDDVNAAMLDQLAEQTRAVSTYVRPAEDIEAKVSGLYSKISHPILANLKLSTTNDVRFSDIFPTQLPDLFHGNQLVVFGRYTGKGAAAIKLTGQIGKETKEFVYELNFADKTETDRDFVEHLWARRKVGYLLDQIRANGDKSKELIEETVKLAKRYGITTPYTSYLLVPDNVAPVARGPEAPKDGRKPDVAFRTDPTATPHLLVPLNAPVTPTSASAPVPLETFIKGVPPGPAPGTGTTTTPSGDSSKPTSSGGTSGPGGPGGFGDLRGKELDKNFSKRPTGGVNKEKPMSEAELRLYEAAEAKKAFDEARTALTKGDLDAVQTGKLGVDFAIQMANLRSQSRLERTANRQVNGRSCIELSGIWIDEGFDPKMTVVSIKAQSDAYFKILEKQPQMKDVYRLGNYVVWITPSGTALVIDAKHGKDTLSGEEIDKLFVAPEKK